MIRTNWLYKFLDKTCFWLKKPVPPKTYYEWDGDTLRPVRYKVEL